MNQAEILKAVLLCYWRYQCRCPIVATEASSWGNADVLSVDHAGRRIETEVKVSLFDMKHDLDKPKHYYLRKKFLAVHPDQPDMFEPSSWNDVKRAEAFWGHEASWGHISRTREPLGICRFYFAVPPDIQEGAMAMIRGLYPYAGLIVVKRNPQLYIRDRVSIEKEAHKFKTRKATMNELVSLVSAMSSTTCRLAVKLYETENSNASERDSSASGSPALQEV